MTVALYDGKDLGMAIKLVPGWAESFGKQLGEQDREKPKPTESFESPELVAARSAGLKKYWEQVKAGQRTRKPRGSAKCK